MPPDDLMNFMSGTTAPCAPYTHTFHMAKLPLKWQLLWIVERPFIMHQAGFGWVFTRRQFNKRITKWLMTKERP